MARNTGLDCDTVTKLKMSYRRMDGDDPVQNGCSWISKCMIKSCEIPLLQTHDKGLSSTTVGPRRPGQKCTSESHKAVCRISATVHPSSRKLTRTGRSPSLCFVFPSLPLPLLDTIPTADWMSATSGIPVVKPYIVLRVSVYTNAQC
jgi:hypothetical protein